MLVQGKRVALANQHFGCVFLSPTAIVMFPVTILQRATVKPPNIIAHEKGFKFHAQPQTGLDIIILTLSQKSCTI